MTQKTTKSVKKPTAQKTNTTVPTVEYKGSQLLRMVRYDNRIARIVIDADKMYTFAEADKLISNYLKKG